MLRLGLPVLAVLCAGVIGIAAHRTAQPDKIINEAELLLTPDVDQFGRATEEDDEIVLEDVPAIARNPIRVADSGGGTIPVCSEPDFADATEDAVIFWNKGL